MFNLFSKRSILFVCLFTAFTVGAQPYCTPVYSTGCSQFGLLFEINDFTFNGTGGTQISDMATGCSTGGYSDRTSLFAAPDLMPGQSYFGTVRCTNGSTRFQIWIDFNNNSVFQTTEIVTPAIVNIPGPLLTIAYQINIPVGATPGVHRMRIRMVNQGTGAIDPCTTANLGETHDYLVNVMPLLPNDLTAGAIVAPVRQDSFCSGVSIAVKAAVYNAGTNPQTGFTVKADYSGPASGSAQTVYSGVLLPQQTDTVLIGQVTPPTGGNYNLKCYTVLTTEQRTQNDTAMKQILVDTSPEGLPNDTTICAPSFPYLLDAGSPGASYLWDNMLGSQLIPVYEADTYRVDITTLHGCFLRDSIILTVDSLPSVAGIALSGTGYTVSFSAGAPKYVSDYFWDLGDGFTDTASSLTHTYASGGTYHVKLVVSNRCGNDTAVFDVLIFSTGVYGYVFQTGGVRIYPNPASDILYVDIPATVRAKQILVADNMGRIVVAGSPVKQGLPCKIDVSGLVPGNYILVVKSDKGNFYEMFRAGR